MAYVSKGYLNLKKSNISFFRSLKVLHSHAMEECHIKAITPLLYNQQDAQLKKNNIALKHILTSITFLVSQNISIYGNFRDLIALICNDIPELKAWFNSENLKFPPQYRIKL